MNILFVPLRLTPSAWLRSCAFARAFHPLQQRLTRSLFIPAITLIGLLSSCNNSPRLLSFPFDPGGRSLNSLASQSTPRIAGRYIVFTSDRRGTQDVYLFDAVEQRSIDLPGLNEFNVIASDPAISENGRYIVFAASRQGRSAIFLYDRETRQLRNLTANLSAEVRHPTISADGSIIAFESSANGKWDLVLCDRSGQTLTVPLAPR